MSTKTGVPSSSKPSLVALNLKDVDGLMAAGLGSPWRGSLKWLSFYHDGEQPSDFRAFLAAHSNTLTLLDLVLTLEDVSPFVIPFPNLTNVAFDHLHLTRQLLPLITVFNSSPLVCFSLLCWPFPRTVRPLVDALEMVRQKKDTLREMSLSIDVDEKLSDDEVFAIERLRRSVKGLNLSLHVLEDDSDREFEPL